MFNFIKKIILNYTVGNTLFKYMSMTVFLPSDL